MEYINFIPFLRSLSFESAPDTVFSSYHFRTPKWLLFIPYNGFPNYIYRLKTYRTKLREWILNTSLLAEVSHDEAKILPRRERPLLAGKLNTWMRVYENCGFQKGLNFTTVPLLNLINYLRLQTSQRKISRGLRTKTCHLRCSLNFKLLLPASYLVC